MQYKTIPQATRNFLLIIAFLSILGTLPRMKEQIALDAVAFWDQPWTVLLTGFYEQQPVHAALACLLLFYAGKQFEHSWGGMSPSPCPTPRSWAVCKVCHGRAALLHGRLSGAVYRCAADGMAAALDGNLGCRYKHRHTHLQVHLRVP